MPPEFLSCDAPLRCARVSQTMRRYFLHIQSMHSVLLPCTHIYRNIQYNRFAVVFLLHGEMAYCAHRPSSCVIEFQTKKVAWSSFYAKSVLLSVKLIRILILLPTFGVCEHTLKKVCVSHYYQPMMKKTIF